MFYSSAVLFCFSVCFLNWPFLFHLIPLIPLLYYFSLIPCLNDSIVFWIFSFFFKECFLRSRVYYLHSFLSSLLSLLPLLHIDSWNMLMELSFYVFSLHSCLCYRIFWEIGISACIFHSLLLWLMKNISCKTRYWG